MFKKNKCNACDNAALSARIYELETELYHSRKNNMPTWLIDKRFEFCYGHRVFTQKLDGEFCENGDTSCKCRYLHGHQGSVHVYLEALNLDNQGMVTDFKHLGWLKNFIDDYVDHKFIISKDDPLITELVYNHINGDIEDYLDDVYFPNTDIIAGQIIIPDADVTVVNAELLPGYFLVDFVPTSENLSRWMFDGVAAKMQSLAKVTKVEWFETPKSRSTYVG